MYVCMYVCMYPKNHTHKQTDNEQARCYEYTPHETRTRGPTYGTTRSGSRNTSATSSGVVAIVAAIAVLALSERLPCLGLGGDVVAVAVGGEGCCGYCCTHDKATATTMTTPSSTTITTTTKTQPNTQTHHAALQCSV